MPTRYGAIKDEHMAVRTRAGLFDVSHMGEVFVRGAGAVDALNALVTNDLRRLQDGQALYTVMCYPDGGVVDDLIIYRLAADELLVCVNASNRAKDFEWICTHIDGSVDVSDDSDSWVQLALQGPHAVGIATSVWPSLAAVAPFGVVREPSVCDGAIVARTGYTGEDGFEFYVPVRSAEDVALQLMEAGRSSELGWIGLAARDSLRLEARLPLYGHELSAEINPVEAGLSWVVKLDKPEFIGQQALAAVTASGPARRLRGLILEGRGMLREGYQVFCDGRPIGTTTSGSVAFAAQEATIALALLDAEFCNLPAVDVAIRDRLVPARVVKSPFYRR
jgi:aminomethyltransferase